MKVRRWQNPEIIKHLRHYFTEDGSFTRDVIATELFNVMITTPEEIFVVVIFDENDLQGFGIAYVPNNRKYVWLAQVWSKPGIDRKYGKKSMEMIKQWAVQNFNIHEIRFETSRNPKAIKRVWGFKKHSTIMNSEF